MAVGVAPELTVLPLALYSGIILSIGISQAFQDSWYHSFKANAKGPTGSDHEGASGYARVFTL